MRIEIKKKTDHQCEYTITRENKSIEVIALGTKIYLLHDICHFAVEKHLKYNHGFWGMLSKGHTFDKLFGKDNPQTVELRFIEQIVGPIQSLYSGHIAKQLFARNIEHLNVEVSENVLNRCLFEIETIMDNWKNLSVGQELILEWHL